MVLARRYFVSGDVQGVGFRYYVLRETQRIGNLTGFVRNLRDGRVEVFAQGEQEQLNKLEGILRQGPRGSTVSNVRISEEMPSETYSDFRITF
jgi:acylphosphatase